MIYKIKLQHLGYTFEMTMDAPSRQEIIRRIQSLRAPVETKIIYIRPDEQNSLQHPPYAG